MLQLTRDEIYKVIGGNLLIHPDKFNPHASLVNSYGLDSLSVFEIPLIIDEAFDIETEIPDNILSKIDTAEEFANFILDYHNVNEQ